MMIPKGYRLYEEFDTSIVLAAVDYLLMFEDAPAIVDYEGKSYERGMIEAIPSELVGNCCSLRRYNLKG